MFNHEAIPEAHQRTTHLAGVGGWRKVFLRFIRQLEPDSVLELGSGDPAFLSSIPGVIRRLALDGNEALRPLYENAGIDFCAFDFDREDPPVAIGQFDVAVCSDVLEHLLYPQKSLQLLVGLLSDKGVLFSHVPNEFRLVRTIKIMLGLTEALYYFPQYNEWDSPHLRRFTDKGYRRFLQMKFKYNLKIADLRYSCLARLVNKLGLPVPYCVEGGPTYASTNDLQEHEQLCILKEKIKEEVNANLL